MKRALAFGLLASLLPLAARAAIDGTVVNRTTGKPEAGVSVTLVKPGQGGMQTLGVTTTDATGHFLFEKDQPGGGPQLLQANYKGVNYNKLMTPNIPTSNVELDIFEATQSPAVAHVAQQMLFIEPSARQLAVSETVIVQNDTTTTYSNPKLGSLRFFLPPAAKGQVKINAQGPQGMPLPQTSVKTEEDNVYKVLFPIKPGQTEFEVAYVLPAGTQSLPGRITGVKGMAGGPMRLVTPPGVTLSGKDVEKVGTEPKTQATVYNVLSTGAFSAAVTGTGSLHSADSAGEAPAVDTSDSPQVTEGKPQIYKYLPALLALTFGILAIGLAILYRNSPVQTPYGR